MKKRFITFLSGMVVGAVMFGGSVCDQRPQLCEIA